MRVRIAGRVVTRTFARRRDADAWALQVEHDRNRGVAVDPRYGQIALADFAGKWLAQRSDLRPTRAKYRWLLNSQVLPVLGKKELGGLTSSGVRSWYMSLRAEHHLTGDDAYRLLRAVYNTALADELTALPVRGERSPVKFARQSGP